MARRGVEAFGNLLAGVLAHSFGSAVTLGIGGVVCLLASLAFASKVSLLKSTSISFYKDRKNASLVTDTVA